MTDICPVAVLRSAGLPLRLIEELTEPGAGSAVDQAGEDAERVAERVLAAADGALTRLCRTDLFQRAVALSNPEILRNAVFPVAEDRLRRRHKRLRSCVALVQRLTAKNDTANGFGPMDLVELGGPAELDQPMATPGYCAEQDGVVAAWVVALLGEAVARDPSVSLPDRLATVVRLDGDHLSVGRRRIRLSARERQALDGGADAEALGRLRRAGLVRRRPRLRPATTDPLRLLIAELRDIPGAARWVTDLEGLLAAARQVAQAPWQIQPVLVRVLRARIERLTGPLPDRPAGAFYTDREVLYQEGRGAASTYRVGGGLLDRIRSGLRPVCDLAARYGNARFRDLASSVREITGPGPTDLVTVLEMLTAAPGWDRPKADSADALVRTLGQRWTRTGTLTADELAAVVGDWPEPDLTVLSPDLMLAAGEPTLVIGEVHANLHTFGLFEHFWPDSDMTRWVTECTSLADRCAQIVTPRSQGKAFLAELPVRSIEFDADATRPDAVPIGQVRLRWDDDRPVLDFPDGQSRTLLPSDQTNPLYLALSPHAGLLPQLCGPGHTRRLTVDGVVVQREQWLVPVPTFAREPVAKHVDMRRWRAASGLPERMFVRTARTPKPFYVDFRNPLLTDLFSHWVQPGEQVRLTEVLPDADGLWLERAGEMFTSELRMSVVREAAA